MVVENGCFLDLIVLDKSGMERISSNSRVGHKIEVVLLGMRAHGKKIIRADTTLLMVVMVELAAIGELGFEG